MKYETCDESRIGFKGKVKSRPKNHEADKMFGQKDLMMALQEKLGCTTREARMMTQAVSASIIESLLKGTAVSIPGVGIIGYKFRAGRTWNTNLHGKTGIKTVPNRLVLKFRAANRLKKQISEAPFQEQVKNLKPHQKSA